MISWDILPVCLIARVDLLPVFLMVASNGHLQGQSSDMARMHLIRRFLLLCVTAAMEHDSKFLVRPDKAPSLSLVRSSAFRPQVFHNVPQF